MHHSTESRRVRTDVARGQTGRNSAVLILLSQPSEKRCAVLQLRNVGHVVLRVDVHVACVRRCASGHAQALQAVLCRVE